MKRLRRWLSDWWHWNGWTLCSMCRRLMRCHDFWNPVGPMRDRVTCSIECCAKADGVTVESKEAWLP